MGESQDQAMTCRRCGACCEKGGPALHAADLSLVRAGHIPLSDLYTLRKGERVMDNVAGVRIRLSSEIVKIKSRKETSCCVYFGQSAGCGIYANRPLECRVLECWNPGPLSAIYTEERLQRGDLLEKYPWLMELVAAHDTECPLSRVAELAENRAAGDPSASARLSELVGYDAAFRTLAVEKGRLNPELLPFLLGRSLGDILKSQFGIQILSRDQAFSSS